MSENSDYIKTRICGLILFVWFFASLIHYDIEHVKSYQEDVKVECKSY